MFVTFPMCHCTTALLPFLHFFTSPLFTVLLFRRGVVRVGRSVHRKRQCLGRQRRKVESGRGGVGGTRGYYHDGHVRAGGQRHSRQQRRGRGGVLAEQSHVAGHG
jgi:hypothetical protein